MWNLLLDRCLATDWPEARTAIRHHLLLCDRRLPNVDTVIEQIRISNQDRKRAGHRPGALLDVPGALALQTAAVWQGWNIVEGPSNRSDDPGDRYIDRFTQGLKPLELARMRTVESLYGTFQVLLQSTPTAPALAAFIQSVTTIRASLQWEEPIRFRAEMWVRETDGRWRKAR
ncbi:MAG: hypothetical protein U0Q16_08075 [Bryobacteraceae bacterium]